MAVYYDDAVLRSAAAELAENFDQAPVDGSYELASDGVYATKPADGRARTLVPPTLVVTVPSTSRNSTASSSSAVMEG